MEDQGEGVPFERIAELRDRRHRQAPAGAVIFDKIPNQPWPPSNARYVWHGCGKSHGLGRKCKSCHYSYYLLPTK